MNSFQSVQSSTQGYSFLISIIQLTLMAGKNVVYEFFEAPNMFYVDVAIARRDHEPETLVIKIFTGFRKDLTPLYYSAKSRWGLDKEIEMCVEILTECLIDADLSSLVSKNITLNR